MNVATTPVTMLLPKTFFEHDVAGWLVDKSVWAEQPMIDFEWELCEGLLRKGPDEIDDV